MSYEIFTSIKYNKNTRNFDCASYSNNVWPHTASKWEMNYFAEKYPEASEQELKAALILAGIYSGDKYNSNIKWANEYKNIAKIWLDSQDSIDYQSFNSIKALAQFYKEYTQLNKKKFVLVSVYGDYITRINKNSYFRSRNNTDAKIFEARTEKELLTNYDIKWLVDSGSYKIINL